LDASEYPDKIGICKLVLMIMISRYRLRKNKKGKTVVDSFEINVCPVCGHILIVIGVRERKYIGSDGAKKALVIRRLRCKGCRVIHHELPDILVPYKRHCVDTVESIIGGDTASACCEERTIQRIRSWWAACRLYFEGALSSLREKYDAVISHNPAPREIVRAVVNSNLWVHTRSAFLSG